MPIYAKYFIFQTLFFPNSHIVFQNYIMSSVWFPVLFCSFTDSGSSYWTWTYFLFLYLKKWKSYFAPKTVTRRKRGIEQEVEQWGLNYILVHWILFDSIYSLELTPLWNMRMFLGKTFKQWMKILNILLPFFCFIKIS